METAALAAEFETHRRYLTAVAFRMLGSRADAEDAVQEAWFRLGRADGEIENLRAWLTKVVSRVCLDQLRTRNRRRERPLDQLPDREIVTDDSDAHARVESADRVGYALMLVLEQLSPDERLAYVLHDVFGLPFDEIAPIVDRAPAAARKLASRARDRVRGAEPSEPQEKASREQRRAVVDAFLAAARSGDFRQLLGVLHPDVEFHIDQGAEGLRIVRGAEQVAASAAEFHRFAQGYAFEILELGDGFAVLASVDEQPSSLLFFTSVGDEITLLETRLLG